MILIVIDPSDFPVKIAAEVKDFSPFDFLPKKPARNTDIFMQFALIAAEEALAQSGVKATPERNGIVLGTALGSISTIESTPEQVLKSGSYRVSPCTVPKISENIGAAQIAILHGLQGPSLTPRNVNKSR